MSHDDTIAAISTPPGEGGIGIVRISGSDAIEIADKIFTSPNSIKLQNSKSHTVTYGFIIDPSTGKKADEVLVTLMRAPKTYTREDVVEINCHGGMVPLTTVLRLLLKEGARPACPGEFTQRAFLNGRIDLSQAEAVIDVIRAKTEEAERIALGQLEGRLSARITALRDSLTNLCAHIEAYIDFPEDEPEVMEKERMIGTMKNTADELLRLSESYDEGRLFREGVSAAIVGKPNVGKSSLLNSLLEKDRAIVTEIPGTTRDVIEDYLNINGLPLKVMDTAGIRDTHDLAEIEGVRRSLKAIESADIVIALLDAGRPIDGADKELIDRVSGKKKLFVVSKADIETPEFVDQLSGAGISGAIRVSSLTGGGISDLKAAIYSLCMSPQALTGSGMEDILITNIRHKHSIDRTLQALAQARKGLENNEPLEVIALYMREALNCLGETIGAVTTDDILNRIFNDFCIGK